MIRVRQCERASKSSVSSKSGPPERGPRVDQPSASLEEAAARLADAQHRYEAAVEERSSAEAERDLAEKEASAARQRSVVFGQQVNTLENELQQDASAADGTPTFDGTTEDAIGQVKALLRRLRGVRGDLDSATQAWRAAVGELAEYARDDQWADLPGLVFRRLAHDPADRVAADAADLANQLRLLKERLAAEIAFMDEHRRLLVKSMAELVSGAVSSLRQATNRSRLPANLGDWSQRPFLKIDFSPPSDPEIEHRLSAFIIKLLEQPAERRPADALLLTRAVLDCVAGGVRVSVLKPNRSMALAYVSIAEMSVFSGGMRATAAIAMFCTLARLRAANRSYARERGVATLILDNPFGDASAVHLVWLQRLVAHSAGIQLVYTTGINDLDALRQFPNPIRLSNELSRRAGLSYVVADPNFLARLWPDGDEARVAATRITRTNASPAVP